METTNEAAVVAIEPTALIEKAIEKGVDFLALEKLMDLQERWEKREAEKAFFQAMNEFQAKKPKLTKGKKVEFGNTS